MSKYTPMIDDRHIREWNQLMKKAIDACEARTLTLRVKNEERQI